jgi:uroporphyrinogen-III synthase
MWFTENVKSVGPKDFADFISIDKKIQRRKISITSIRSIKCRCTNNTKQPKSRLDSSFYKTVMSDLSDLADVYYDILAFFSPTGIKSLAKNLPEQNDTRIAVFGSTTQRSTRSD